MKFPIIIGTLVFIIILTSFSIAYESGSYSSLNFTITKKTVTPIYSSLNFTFGETTTPPTDSCTYTSSNWVVDCSDDCSITSAVNLGGNDITITGTGTFTTTKNITNWGDLTITGTDSSNRCIVTCQSGGCFY